MSYYSYKCPTCGVVIIDKPFGTANDTEVCPYCKSEAERIYNPTNSIWKTSGAYGKSSNN